MEVCKSSKLLEGFAFTNYDMIVVAQFTLLVTVQKNSSIVGAVSASVLVGFSDVKNRSATDANAPWCLKRVKLASAHSMDA